MENLIDDRINLGFKNVYEKIFKKVKNENLLMEELFINDEKISNFLVDYKLEYDICISNNFYYYFYSCESIDDTNWGCAWRAIQTLLSSYLIFKNEFSLDKISFLKLFSTYFGKSSLLKIYGNILNDNKSSDKSNVDISLEKLKMSKFSPEESNSYWAEPFISYLISADFGINYENHRIVLVNSYPKYANAPNFIFQYCLEATNFFNFLKEYYSDDNKNKFPMVIDDSTYCYNIIGIAKSNVKENSENIYISIIFSDPHIYNIENYKKGIYILNFDKEGKQLNEEKSLNSKIYFNEKPWMLHFLTFK